MDRRSFLKAATATAIVPVLPAVAAPPPEMIVGADFGTVDLTGVAVYRNCTVLYEHGTRWFCSAGEIVMTILNAELDPTMTLAEQMAMPLGDVHLVLGEWE